VTETEEKRKAGNAKLENLIPSSRRPQLCTDKTSAICNSKTNYGFVKKQV